MEKALAFLQDAQAFYLATAEENGQPRVRPFGAACQFDGKLCIMTNNQKKVYQQLKKNPKIEISGMLDGKWIRLCAEAYEDDRREARVAMLKANPKLESMYNADDGLMAVFFLRNATAQICSFTEPSEEFSF